MPASRPLVLAVAALLGLGALTGCSGGGGGEVSTTSGPTATAAPAAGAELDAEAFAAALKRPGTTVLDVRTPGEFAEGHLPGAVNVDVSSADFAVRVAQLDPTAPYAVYCRSGNRSAAALSEMGALGFGAAYHLAGGITAWEAAGGEVVTG